MLEQIRKGLTKMASATTSPAAFFCSSSVWLRLADIRP